MKDILFIIGSESDKSSIEPGIALIKEKGLSHTLRVFSAHRNLPELLDFLKNEEKNYRVIISAAGLSAALPGVIASQTKEIPVLGIPLVSGSLGGIDSLMSILQMPKGVPLGTMGIGKQGILNAVHFAERIIRSYRR